MSSASAALYTELQRARDLQQLLDVLSKDVTTFRDVFIKETTSIRKQFIFYRWCMRKDLNVEYPFPKEDTSKPIDSDQLLFYRKLIYYLHSNPNEFGKIIVSLPDVKNQPNPDSLQSLYFNKEVHLVECIVFDIMLTDINSLIILLRSILTHSDNFNILAQKLFQLFIFVTCYKLLNTKIRFV